MTVWLLTIRDVGERLQCSKAYVYVLLQRGELRALKLGRLTRIPVEAVEEFIAQKVESATYDVCERWAIGGERDDGSR